MTPPEEAAKRIAEAFNAAIERNKTMMVSEKTASAKTANLKSPQEWIGLSRSQQQRQDGLSSTLQVSKASEHLVCAELLLRGWNVFIADAGLPYDVVVDLGNGLFCRIQVKSTTRMYGRPGYSPIYRFAIRRSRTGERRVSSEACDYFAFVALDRRLIAWLPAAQVRTRDGLSKILIEFKTRAVAYERNGSRGCDPSTVGKFIEDFTAFTPGKGRPHPYPWTECQNVERP